MIAIEVWLLTTNILFFLACLFFVIQSACRMDRCTDEKFTRAFLAYCFSCCRLSRKSRQQQNSQGVVTRRQQARREREERTTITIDDENGKVGEAEAGDDDDDDDDDGNEGENNTDDDHFTTTRQVRSLIRKSTLQAEQFGLKEKIRQQEQAKKTQERLSARQTLKMRRTMSRVPGFEKLKDDAIHKIIDQMDMEKFGVGGKSKVVCKQGALADRLYVIMQGTVEIVIGGVKVREMGANNFFGETALLSGIDHKRGALVNAVTSSSGDVVTMLILTRQAFVQLEQSGVITTEVVDELTRRHEQWKTADDLRQASSDDPVFPPPPFMVNDEDDSHEV